MFLATLLYAIGFFAGFGVPKHIDNGIGIGASTTLVLAIDIALLTLFAVQHSLIARPAFKRWRTRLVPPVIGRSNYVLFSSLALISLSGR